MEDTNLLLPMLSQSLMRGSLNPRGIARRLQVVSIEISQLSVAPGSIFDHTAMVAEEYER
jgi:hypothetical protein